jgi:hypothetical protein
MSGLRPLGPGKPGPYENTSARASKAKNAFFTET